MFYRIKYLLSLLLLASLCGSLGCSRNLETASAAPEGPAMDGKLMAEWQLKMLADPATGRLPDNFRNRELAHAAGLPVSHQSRFARSEGPSWRPRGPWNVGGRTRALAIDMDNESRILAAGVSGGLWESTNGGQSWHRIPSGGFINITCIVQNPGNHNEWYCGTGELIGNSPSGPAAFYLGNGIIKSTDNGRTWQPVSFTNSNTPQVLAKDFDLVHNMAIRHHDGETIVYAATYRAIWRSLDGGETWARAKGNVGLTVSVYSDVHVAENNNVFLYLSPGSSDAGVWRSTDGKDFTRISVSGYPVAGGRAVLATDPNRASDRLYVFMAMTKDHGQINWDKQRGDTQYNSLFRYDYISGNGTGTGGEWTDLSQNLPQLGGDFGDLNTQTGYNMICKVLPGSSNTVFIGGTNLYRSTDAFTSQTKTTWIAGFDPASKRPGYILYPGNHPDQHNLIFFKSNPKKAYNTHDGGISLTDDITAASISWHDLNRGYLTTQFYTVAIDQSGQHKDYIIGGLQDNGTYHTGSANLQDFWTTPMDADGFDVAVGPGAKEIYTTRQLGHVYRVRLNDNLEPVGIRRLDPLSENGKDFRTKFALDPLDFNRIYFPGHTRLWVHDDTRTFQEFAKRDTNRTDEGWRQIAIPALVGNAQISCVKAFEIAGNTYLFYGTSNGKLYKISDPSSTSPEVEELTGSNFPPNAYFHHLAMHPTEKNRLLAVFSNYSVESIYYSEDGGQNWKPVGGNLESRNHLNQPIGPSVRWADFLPLQDGSTIFFAATSTGLYATDSLNGSETEWIRQAGEYMGTMVVVDGAVRPSDGMVAVATHGVGMYSATYVAKGQIHTGISRPAVLGAAVKVVNPVGQMLTYHLPEGCSGLTVEEIYTTSGQLVSRRQVMAAPGMAIESEKVQGLPKGIYVLSLQNGGKAWHSKFLKN